MLTIPRSQLIEKLITSAEGIVFKAFFLVYEEDGKVKARLVRAIPISKKISPVVFALAGDVQNSIAPISIIKVKSEKIISPFNSILYFAGSKPRAPSFIL
jgi:hypothetical protein